MKMRCRGRMGQASAGGRLRGGRRAFAEPPDELGNRGLVGGRELEASGPEPGDDPRELPKPVVLRRSDQDANELAGRVERSWTALTHLVQDRRQPALDLGDADGPRNLEDLAGLSRQAPHGRRVWPLPAADNRAKAGSVVGELREH